MSTLLVMYDLPGWAYHRRADCLKKFAPSGWTVDILGQQFGLHLNRYDAVLQMCYQRIGDVAKYGPKCLVSSYTVSWEHCPADFWAAYRASKLITVHNKDVYSKAVAAGADPRRLLVYCGGPDQTVFREQVMISRRPAKVLWSGSLEHAGEKRYRELALPLKAKLEAAGILCDFRAVSVKDASARFSAAQMADWYNGGSVFVITSSREGTPSVGLEAAACGLPIVSTAVGVMPELIVHGENGFIVEPTVESLFSAVKSTLEQRESMSQDMLRRVVCGNWLACSQTGVFFERLSLELGVKAGWVTLS